jgi:hypothetical protein
MKIITDAELQQDLVDLYDRLQIARSKLNNLPVGYLPHKEHKKRGQKRRILNDEIEHVKRLIGIAEEALST